MGKIENINRTETKERLICYPESTVNRMIEVLNQIEVKGISNVTALAAIVNLLNTPTKAIENDGGEK